MSVVIFVSMLEWVLELRVWMVGWVVVMVMRELWLIGIYRCLVVCLFFGKYLLEMSLCIDLVL